MPAHTPGATDGRCTTCRYHYFVDIGPGIALCPTHAAAPEMLALVCDMLSQYTEAADEGYAPGPQERIWTERARALLVKVRTCRHS